MSYLKPGSRYRAKDGVIFVVLELMPFAPYIQNTHTNKLVH